MTECLLSDMVSDRWVCSVGICCQYTIITSRQKHFSGPKYAKCRLVAGLCLGLPAKLTALLRHRSWI